VRALCHEVEGNAPSDQSRRVIQQRSRRAAFPFVASDFLSRRTAFGALPRLEELSVDRRRRAFTRSHPGPAGAQVFGQPGHHRLNRPGHRRLSDAHGFSRNSVSTPSRSLALGDQHPSDDHRYLKGPDCAVFGLDEPPPSRSRLLSGFLLAVCNPSFENQPAHPAAQRLDSTGRGGECVVHLLWVS
jgi:hypothetical protein